METWYPWNIQQHCQSLSISFFFWHAFLKCYSKIQTAIKINIGTYTQLLSLVTWTWVANPGTVVVDFHFAKKKPKKYFFQSWRKKNQTKIKPEKTVHENHNRVKENTQNYRYSMVFLKIVPLLLRLYPVFNKILRFHDRVFI